MNEPNENLQTLSKPLSQREVLHQTALKAPNQSGVYMWRNEGGTIIYVGKAKNLKNRLTSYFSGNKDIKTRLLISRARSIEYITTGNEYEAFLLENNLIKQHNPRYNICLKDGKSYPVLKITREKFPRLYKTRNVVKDGSVYFGPFPDAAALDTFIETLYDIYPLRHCKKFREKDSGCLYYHMGKCIGPCFKKTDDSTYGEFIGEITSLLEGKDDTVKKIEEQMKQAAKELKFEKAARLRDGLKALSIMQNQNIVEGFDQDDRDYIATWREGELVSFTILKMRNGKLLGRDNYRTLSMNEDTELIPEFMCAYYTEKEIIPPSIYVVSEEGTQFMKRWLKETYGMETEIIPVDDSEKMRMHRAAVNMAQQNAKEDIVRRVRERGDFPAMEELKKELGLSKLPVRIEGFDIAHIGGKFPVASLISFYNGNPDKKNYRYFRLKTTDGLIDDFASMKEAVSRRYTRLLNEKAELPDLLLIDGGIGQVNAVDSILRTLGLDIPIAGLAKRDEEIWRPHTSNPICLPKRSDGLRLLQRVRDETHRFATSRNQELRTKENTVSIFKEISGVGPKREAQLIKKYGIIASLASATEADIAETLGIKAEAASDILLQARNLYIKQKEKQDMQRESLGMPGTTKEKAARFQMNHNLAAMALLEVASPDSENKKENSDLQGIDEL